MVVDKAALLNEFNTVIAPQKAAISQRLPQLFQQYYAPPRELPAAPAGANGTAGAAGPGAVPGKRPFGDAGAPDSKRLKPQPSAVTDADKRIEALFRDIGNILSRKLLARKEANPFKDPVDPVKEGIPDYFKYITQPMDLGTVRNKLSRKEYKTPMEVCDDVRLVFRNCATYNQIGHPVRQYGDTLSDVWEKAWAEARIEERWAEVQLQKDPTGSVVPYRAAQLNSQLKTAINLVPQGTVQPSDTMSDLEKRKLSIQLADLQGEQLAELLQVLQDDLPPSGSEEEIELDLDQLPNATLQKMQSFVNRVAGGRGAGAIYAAAPNKQALKQEPARPAAAPTPAPDDDDMAVAGSSGHTSPAMTVDSQDNQEVKGSTMDDVNGKAPFVMANNRVGVDESATAPNASSSILRDRQAARKSEVQVDAAAWDVSALQPADQDEDQGQDAEDEIWQNFKTKEEKAKQQAEEQRKLKEQQEEELRKVKEAEAEEARRAANEVEERERALRAEEEKRQEEEQRARREQCDKEVDEIKARQGTAQLIERDDMQSLTQVQPDEGDLAAVGLTYRNDDEDVNFDDDDS